MLEMNETDRCSTCLNSSPNTQTGGVHVWVVVCVCCVYGQRVNMCVWGLFGFRECAVACMYRRSSGRWHHFVCLCSYPSRLPSTHSWSFSSLPFPFYFLLCLVSSFLFSEEVRLLIWEQCVPHLAMSSNLSTVNCWTWHYVQKHITIKSE